MGDKNKKWKTYEPFTMSGEEEVDATFPHFLVVESASNEPIPVSILLMQRMMQRTTGSTKSTEKLRNNSVIVDAQKSL